MSDKKNEKPPVPQRPVPPKFPDDRVEKGVQPSPRPWPTEKNKGRN